GIAVIRGPAGVIFRALARQRDASYGDGRPVMENGSSGEIDEFRERERELAEKVAVLQTTLDNIDQGITMVDKNLRAVALNRRFYELLDFPRERFGCGFPMEQAFRFNAERGEY